MEEHNKCVYKEVIGVSDEGYAGMGDVVQELERELFNQGEEFFPCEGAAQ
jgi:hypothetical protein